MNPPPAGDALPAFDFLSEFIPAPDFGKSFGFNRLFNFDDAGDSPLFSGYDDDLCSFSVESYVRIGRRRRRRKKRQANPIYRKQSVLLSPSDGVGGRGGGWRGDATIPLFGAPKFRPSKN
jgi:hypothetical protein